MYRLAAVLFLATVACGGAPKEPPTALAPATPPPAPASAEAATSKTMTGKLRFEEAPQVMSAEAYHHVEFTLVVDDGMPVNLTTSSTVTRDDLKAMDGKKVEIVAVWQESSAPSDMEAHPIDPATGEAEKRAGKWSVTSIHEAGK
jgi:hypothetical protein